MKNIPTIDSKILQVLADGESHSEWDIASCLHNWNDSRSRSKHGAWIRSIVQALWRMEQKGLVFYFWVSHGAGTAGDRMWFSAKDRK